MYIPGNSPKSLAKGKNGRPQNFKKGGVGNFPNAPRNTQQCQGRLRGVPNPQKNFGNFADKRPPAKGFRRTERFDPVSVV